MNGPNADVLAASLAEPGASAPEILERIVAAADSSGASDVHLQMDGNGAELSFRLDGVIKPVATLPAELAGLVSGRVKFLARLKTYQDTMPQEGRIARGEIGSRSDIRVSTYPAVIGEKIVLRLFQESHRRSLIDLQFPDEAHLALERFLRGNAGLLLLTGPAGSGKTTTIYASLRHVARDGRHIVTIEDPAEQIVEGVMQTEVNEARGLTFAKAAKHLLRQDPEVLVIGEIRDQETAGIAVQAAMTGHMVIATLHAGSCRRVLERLLLMSDDHYSAVSALEMVINQRLVRRLCPACRGAGCADCLRTGYRGRVPAVEWLTLDDPLRAAVRQSGPESVTPATNLRDAGRLLVEQGVTNEAEFGRVFGP